MATRHLQAWIDRIPQPRRDALRAAEHACHARQSCARKLYFHVTHGNVRRARMLTRMLAFWDWRLLETARDVAREYA
jgi:hypothetical protein